MLAVCAWLPMHLYGPLCICACKQGAEGAEGDWGDPSVEMCSLTDSKTNKKHESLMLRHGRIPPFVCLKYNTIQWWKTHYFLICYSDLNTHYTGTGTHLATGVEDGRNRGGTTLWQTTQLRVDKISETPLSMIFLWLSNIMFATSWKVQWSPKLLQFILRRTANSWHISIKTTNVNLMVRKSQGIAKVIKGKLQYF